jgi:hypothetical protein
VKEAKFKAKRRLNILRCLAGTTWGADREVLLKAHHAVILSALRYGETAYGAASEKTLKTLDPIHNEGLRISIGAFCVTKTTEVLREADELSLKEMRNKNMAICGVRIKAKRNHPLNRSSDRETRERLEEKRSLPAPFPFRVIEKLNEPNINPNKIWENEDWTLPPWEELDEETIDTDMLPFSKENRTVIIQNFQQQMDSHQDHKHIYTDGSKADDKVGYSIVEWGGVVKRRLDNRTIIYTAEATAIQAAGAERQEKWEKRLF